MLQNSKADDVFPAFSNCFLIRTPPYSSRGDVSTVQRAECLLCRWRCDDFPFYDSNFQMLSLSLRTEYAAAQGNHWYLVFIGLPWMLQWHWHGFAILSCSSKQCAWQREDPLSSKCSWAAPLVLAALLRFSLYFLVFVSWIGFRHPSKDFGIKSTNFHLTPRIYISSFIQASPDAE